VKSKKTIIIGLLITALIACFAVVKWWAYHRGDMIFYLTTQTHLVLPDGRSIPANRWLRGVDVHRDWKQIGLLRISGENFLVIGGPHGLVNAGSDTNLIIRVDRDLYRSDEDKHRYWISEAARPSELTSPHYQ
jgi:hypothetical protein